MLRSSYASVFFLQALKAYSRSTFFKSEWGATPEDKAEAEYFSLEKVFGDWE